MIGKRRPDRDPCGADTDFGEGDYGRLSTTWFACAPGGHLGNLSKHTVIEHEDGTITVSPSIRISAGGVELWHGWLERGVWRSC
jgi:hypothetical protein